MCDYNLADQEPFVKAFRHIIGEHSVYPLMAVEKIKEKAAWQMYASVSGIDPKTANEVSRYIDAYNEELKTADEDDKDSIHIEDFIPKEYMDVYMGSREWQNITINLKVHACGHIVLEGDVRRKIGLISALSKTTGKRTLCACVEGSYLDSFGMVKNDFLIVQVVALIKECWDSIGKPVPTFEELRELVDHDEPTWNIYKIGSTCCVNQLEKSATAAKAKIYKPQNIAELSAFIAGIRPGFKSLIGNFLTRQPYTTGEPKIDELLEDSYHYLLYQESIMKLLGFLGLPMQDCYGVIKAISKKKLKGEKLERLREQLTNGWMKQIGNMDNFDKVWQVINDAARYSFNSPHSLSMAGDSLYLAWFKAHHTAKFYETAINHYQDSGEKLKVEALLAEAKDFYGYKMGAYRFGDDNRRVKVDESTHIIYPSLSPIKSISANAADILYEARDKATQFTKRGQLYEWLSSSGINATTRNILFEIGYFSAYGKINQLKAEYAIYEKYANSKTLAKSQFPDDILPQISACCEKETSKQFRGIDNKRLINILILNAKIPPTTAVDAIQYSLDRLGYCTISDSSFPIDQYVIADVDISPYGTVKCSLYNISLGAMKRLKMNGRFWSKNQLNAGDVVEALIDDKPTYKKDEDGKWVKDGGTEKYVKVWRKVLDK